TCSLSPSSAGKAENLSYTTVRVFHDGMPAWKKAGNMVFTAAPYLKETIDKDIPTVLIDVRPTKDAKKEHIKGAVSIPLRDIKKTENKFPADKKAPIIIYCDNGKASAKAFKVVRGWGYENTSVLEGGIGAWKNAGNPLERGKLSTQIVYVPKPMPGTISIEEFKTIAETKPVDKLILDVREVNETAKGMLIGAMNIPASEIFSRLSDIPKDKEVITHCATGVRAEMAYHMLKDAGYKVRFLKATIKIDKDGKYEITQD
ncbi:MAG: rhodanese-like domain-containing protein, partial [Nitrospirae bacterium]|nr:rhodanese-like domain-containing protein [Nitrospirota bacterium]